MSLGRSLLLTCSTRTELECLLKQQLNIAEDSAVKVRWNYGLEPTELDATFVPSLEYGLAENLEAAGHISVIVLDGDSSLHLHVLSCHFMILQCCI